MLASSFSLQGRLSHLKGNLTVMATGSQQLVFSSTTTTGQIIVDGDFTIAGSAHLDLINSSGVFKATTGGNVVVNTSSIFNLASQGTGIINPGKDVLVVGGTISETGSATGEFLFDSGRKHKFVRGVSGTDGT